MLWTAAPFVMLFQVKIRNHSLQTLSHTTEKHMRNKPSGNLSVTCHPYWQIPRYIYTYIYILTQDIYTYILLSLWTHDRYLIVLWVVFLLLISLSWSPEEDQDAASKKEWDRGCGTERLRDLGACLPCTNFGCCLRCHCTHKCGNELQEGVKDVGDAAKDSNNLCNNSMI